jgi:predicted nucleic acid-binding protein
MMPMNSRVFLDSNILVYSYSATEHEKRTTARRLITDNLTFISTQVLQELCNILTKKFGFSYTAAALAIEESSNNNVLFTNKKETITLACDIAERYKFSFYDSLIVASALQCQCDVLYSEDLHHGQLIEGVLSIKNPF